ncbi:MAG: helix-turn-helix domain-containing protein [Pseudomonadota bacterium]
MLRLPSIRKQKGISQIHLAKELGITRHSLCRLERGKFNPEAVPWRRARQLEDILGEKAEVLFSEAKNEET